MVLTGTRAYFKRKVKTTPPVRLASVGMDRIRRILLVSNTAIGDTLLSTPAIRSVKKTFPDRLVGLVFDVRNELLVRYNPYVDRFHRFQSKFYGMKSLIREVRATRYDLAVILHGNDPESVPLCYASGIRTIIGTASSRFRFLTSDPVPVPGSKVHAIERRLEYVRLFGGKDHGVQMDLVIPLGMEWTVSDALTRSFGPRFRPLVALHPAGSGSYKWWPARRFVELADRLWERFRARILVVCGPREAELGDSIAQQARAPAVSTSGRYNLLEVAGMLRQCALMVSTDSGPMHMAFALKVPTLALIGADHPDRIGPYGVDGAAVIYKKETVCSELDCLKERCAENVCLKAIQVEEVWDRIVNRFGETLTA